MIFWILVTVLVAVAIFWIAPSLLREQHLNELDRKQQNINIAKERLDEIAADHAAGAMTDQVFEQTREELQASLVDDVDQQDAESEIKAEDSKRYGKVTWLVLVVLIPLTTLGMYHYLGSPEYLEYAGGNAGRVSAVSPHAADTPASMAELVEKLKQRLEKNPEDGEGWFLLSKTYMAESRYAEAMEALKKTHAIYGDYPAILLGMADATAMLRQGNLTGEPAQWIDKALEMEPTNTTGLWLGGMAAQQNGEFQLAVNRWSKLMPLLAADPVSQQQVQGLISEAVGEAKQSGIEVNVAEPQMPVAETAVPEQLPTINEGYKPETDAPAIKAWVALDAAMAEKASANDVVFVFARAKSGPPMPLAAFKTTVGELPMEVTLDDSMAMMPQMKLSSFDEVVVSARVSKSGQPRSMPGDLSSALETVKLDGVVGIELTIVEVVQ